MKINAKLFLCLCCFFVLSISVSSEAATFRVGLIIGNNQGNHDRHTLRYAESDAKSVYDTLVQLGNFSTDRLFLLVGKGPLTLEKTFGRIKAMSQNLSRSDKDEVIFFLYFSGHLENGSIELGNETISLDKLKKMILSLHTSVKIAILDACHSGAILMDKGGEPAAAFFPVNVDTEILPRGEVFITSSTEVENSYESSKIQGSFFTHFLLSGLRGEADFNHDKRVTLSEAYSYAADKTIKKTLAIVGKSQHPSYDFQLSGGGEIILADLAKDEPVLLLDTAEEGMFSVYRWPNRSLIAEIEKKRGIKKKFVLPQGNLILQKDNGKFILEKELLVEPRGFYAIDWKDARKRPYHAGRKMLFSLENSGAKKQLPEGDLIPLRLTETVNSKFANAGDKISLESAEDILIDGVQVVPAGSPATGEILSVRKKRGLSSGILTCRLGYVQAIDGQWIPLNSIVSRAAHGAVLNDPEEAIDGSARSTTAIDIASTATAIVLFPFYPFIQGRHAIIKEGTIFDAYVAKTSTISSLPSQ